MQFVRGITTVSSRTKPGAGYWSPWALPAAAWLVAACAFHAAAAAPDQDPNALAREILAGSGVEGGLIVHAGCGDGRLTVALRANDRYLALGLDTDPEHVDEARERARSLGLSAGSVSFDRFDGEHLPLIDNLVNLVVAGDSGAMPMKEALRVLCPGGVAYVKEDGRWTKRVKPRPDAIDDWTHFLHGPDGNAVARDDVVGFPYHIQWIGSPRHSRDHELTTSMDVMVSAAGRIFYIIDEGPTALPHWLPSRWYLVARDAFNGVVLWKRPLAEWRPFLVSGRKSLAADLWRRLVATDDAVYVTPTLFGPVTALDPATGEILRVYPGTEKTEEIICQRGILYLAATTSDPEDVDRRQLAQQRIEPDRKRLMAVAADTGEILWTREDDDTEGVHPLTLAVKDGRLLFQNTREVICLESATGDDVWRFSRPSGYARPGYATPTLVVYDDVVLSADRVSRQTSRRKSAPKPAAGGSELIALSADDGRELWRCRCGENVGAAVDVFVAGGLVWVGENPRRGASDYNHGRNLHTGEIEKSFSHAENWPTWHHHRCYRDKATEKYILAGRTGIEFVDLASGDLVTHHWVRGICEYGILPANGLIYSPPDQCACYIESKLNGFHALAPKRRAPDEAARRPARLEEGPAYGRGMERAPSATADSFHWPTFRHDNRRSSHTRSAIPLRLRPDWKTPIGGKLTSLVSTAGKVFVAQPETHRVFCLDSHTGQISWSYQAGGRVDSPPSVSRGTAVFGCRDGWVYALRAADGRLVWRFRAAPEDRRLVETGQVASVWPVHGSVLIENGGVYLAAGRSSFLDDGMVLYKLDLETGEALVEKPYYGRDPETGERIDLYTPYDGEVLPDRELPGLLPDVFSSDEENLYLRAVPMSRDLVIRDKVYVPHLFSSTGFLEDTWWERTYWIYGLHFYGGARGHGYAKTLFPAGRILSFDEESVYGYQDLALDAKAPGIFRVPKIPEFVDLAEKLGPRRSTAAKPGRNKKSVGVDPESLRQTYVWNRGVPQNPQAMLLTGGKGTVKDAIRRLTKYEFAWHNEAPLYPHAMLLTDDAFFVAGPPRFDEEATTRRLAASGTDRFRLDPLLETALDTFAGRRGGVLCAVDKATGRILAELRLPSSPVFDGMIAADGKLFLALKDGSIVCMKGP
ncbi:MAG: outer membrane protein assembly factor BamB family protein [Planctomycetota bacterium]|jgi:outer membrane protein assembly factor BamB